LEKEIEKLKTVMIDPSLMSTFEFWESSGNFQNLFSKIYFPRGLRNVPDSEFREFYGSYRKRILKVEEMFGRGQGFLESFSWEEHQERIPDRLTEIFYQLRGRLEESDLSRPISQIMLDEFVFLSTQSSIISRLKKSFKMFEKLKVFPLINLEKMVPEEWQSTAKGIKTSISLANWIATLGRFSISLGFSGTVAVEGIRLLLIDP
jgi:hypothetical protein